MKKPVKKVTPKIKAARHAAALKAARTRATKKITPAVKAARHAAALRAARTRAVNKAKPRQLSPGVAVACCSAEALAASLRLSGRAVSDEDVLALYWHTAGDPDAGASIQATLEAAAEFGLAGVRLARFTPAGLGDFRGTFQPAHPRLPGPELGRHVTFGGLSRVILGLDLPGPHAVLDTGSEWISWGEPWPATTFPDVVIEEAWEVSWPDFR